jgi:transcriptional regulator with XRE-family HTH domain
MKVKIHKTRFKGAIRLRTQTAIARELGISQPALTKKLKGLERMRFSDFNQICEILKEDPREFLTFEGSKEGNEGTENKNAALLRSAA